MAALAIVQARSGSARLPRKVLAPILDRPLVLRLLDRIAPSTSLDSIVVATTVSPDDDELAAVLSADGVIVRRGPVDDVLARFLQVADEFDPATIVRLTADNPLVDAATVDRVVEAHLAAAADYTTNGLSRTYPHGLNVEAVETQALRALCGERLTSAEREHVTLGLLNRPEQFSLVPVGQAVDRSALRWTVDLAEDLDWVREIFRRLHPADPFFGQDDVVGLIAEVPELRRTQADLP